MDTKCLKKIDEFVEELEKEQVYIDYLKYKSIIEKDAQLRESLNNFRREQFESQINHLYGDSSEYDDLIQLQSRHDGLLSEPVINKFLKAELELSDLLKNVFNVIANRINFDLDFLN